MLYLYTAHVLASQAQRRHFDGVRLDGRVTDKPALWRSLVATVFTRSAPATARAQARLPRLAAA